MNKTRLEITDIELTTLSPTYFEWERLGDFYITKLIKTANELWLKGKEITEIIGVKEIGATSNKYIDFITK